MSEYPDNDTDASRPSADDKDKAVKLTGSEEGGTDLRGEGSEGEDEGSTEHEGEDGHLKEDQKSAI